jgi:P27 family predicted phage terminase small subunit
MSASLAARRAPKPRAFAQLADNPTAQQNPALDPQFLPVQNDYEMPVWFDHRHVKKWQELVDQLQAAGIYQSVDHDTILSYVATWVRWQDAEATIWLEGAIVDHIPSSKYGAPTKKKNPAVDISMQCQRQLVLMASVFGFNPSARSRINMDAMKHANKNKPQAQVRKDNAAKRIFGSAGALPE